MRTVVAKTGFRAGKTEFFATTTTTPRRSSLVLFFLTTVSSSDVSRRSSSSSSSSSATTTTTGKEDVGYYTGKKRNPLTDTRLYQYDKRPPPNALCGKCSRRFCSCESKSKTKPEMPGPEDCCQSSPQCKFCVWTIYDEQLTEYETNKELYMDKLK